MDTSYFERLPQSVQQLVVDGLDAEVQSGLERLDEAKKHGPVDPEHQAALESDIKIAAELRNRFSPA